MLSVFAALVVCVGYMCCGTWVLSVLAALVYMLAICEVGYLASTWCKRGVALVKFQTCPISYGVTGCECVITGHVRIDP